MACWSVWTYWTCALKMITHKSHLIHWRWHLAQVFIHHRKVFIGIETIFRLQINLIIIENLWLFGLQRWPIVSWTNLEDLLVFVDAAVGIQVEVLNRLFLGQNGSHRFVEAYVWFGNFNFVFDNLLFFDSLTFGNVRLIFLVYFLNNAGAWGVELAVDGTLLTYLFLLGDGL